MLHLTLPVLAILHAGAAEAGQAAKKETPHVDFGDGLRLTVDGQIRPRFLYDTGKDFVSGDDEMMVSQRSRIGATLGRKGGPSLTVRIQDVRAWGEEVDTLKDFTADGLDAHEAFVTVPFGRGTTLRLGRQEITLDNHRLVGNVGWSTQARSFDGVRLDRKGDGYDFTAFAVALDPAIDSVFGGLHLGFQPAEGHRVNVVALGRALEMSGENIQRHTVGLNATGKAGGLGYTLEGYYQLGDEGGESVSAWMAAVNASFTADSDIAPGVLARAELLSGDGTPQGTFDTLYATNHKFYGEMDFFLAIPAHTANLGLMDVGGKVYAKPAKGVKVSVDVHHFAAMTANDAGETAFGDEIDAKVIRNFGDGLAVRALYGIFLPGEAMRTPKGIPTDTALEPEHFFYLTTDFKL